MRDPSPGKQELECLFCRGLLTRQEFIRSLLALGATVSGIEALLGTGAAPALAQTQSAKYLVLIVLDAFRPDYISLAPMPALTALMRAGTSFDRAWVAQLESETPTGHAALSTGALPRRNGIIGFEWRDPQTKQERLDGWPKGVLAGAMERDMKAAGASSIPRAIKAAEPTATVVALSSEKVYAADAMGASAADYVLYHQRSGPGNLTLTPSAVPGRRPPEDFFHHPHLQTQLPMKRFTDWDYLSDMLALTALQLLRPKALMVNFPGADFYGHPYGGPANPGVMAQVAAGLDRNIARIVQAYRQAGLYDQTLFVVTADHGMIANSGQIDGSTTKATVKAAGGQYLFHTGGSAADIYLRDPVQAKSVATQMARLPGTATAYYQVNDQSHFTYVPAPGIAIDPRLDDAYQYLLSTFAGPTAPDVVTPFRENRIGALYTVAHGDHGGLSWGAQHIPVIMSGPGVRKGVVSRFPARLIDVAPTVLRVLGVPSGVMDGIVLADALSSPTATEVADQAGLVDTLTAHQDALIAQSVDNIAEDDAMGIVPPPPAPPRP